MYDPVGLAYDMNNSTLYIAEPGNRRIRVLNTITYELGTLCGTGNATWLDGLCTGPASFVFPSGLLLFHSMLVVSDRDAFRIRAIDLISLNVSTLAGASTQANADGVGTGAKFTAPRGLSLDPRTGLIYIADFGGGKIRTLNTTSYITSTVTAPGAQSVLFVP